MGEGGGLLQVPRCQRAPGWPAMSGARRVGSYILARVLGGGGGGGGGVGSLQATPPAAGGGREVRGRGMGPGRARVCTWSVGCERECQGGE